jgi:uncharacterized protein (DUF1330 family)
MPKGYVIYTETVNDEEGMGAYVQAALPTLVAAGGTPIVFGPTGDVVEGDWHGKQTVILEFASLEAARGWYNSAEYQALIGKRQAAAQSNVMIIGGFEMPTG